MTLATNILRLFRGRPDYVAVGADKAFAPHQLTEPMKPAWLESEHLSGKRCLGFYLLTADSQCYCSCVDFDNKPDTPDEEWQQKTEQVFYFLVKLGLSPLVEISQSGTAAHVWLFFEEAIDAWLVRQFWAAIEKQTCKFVEVYPRQDELSGKGLGNLIRYPFWGQSRLIDVEAGDPESGWLEADDSEARDATRLDEVKLTDEVTLRTIIYHLTGKTPRKPEVGVVESGLPARVDRLISRQHTLLARRWAGDMEGLNDKSRSALCLSIGCELVRLYVPTPEVEAALRVWCNQNDYDKGQRDDWIATTIQKSYEFLGTRQAERLGTSTTMRDAALGYVEELKKGKPTRYGTGISELDYSIDGVAPGEMCVIAARPSHGKSALGLQWLDSVASLGTPCLIISEEMSRQELGKRAILSISHLSEDVWHDKTGVLFDDINEHYDRRSTIHLVESCQTISEVERQVDEHVELHGVKMVAVDYLQLLGSEHTSRYESVTDVSRRLKQTAMRNNVALLVMCQLNRETEKRDGFEPRLSDLRDSGGIEQDCDTALLLQWPVRHDHTADPTLYKIFCAKRRNGPIRTGVVFTEFDPNRQRFGKLVTDLDWQPAEGEYASHFG